MENGTLLIVFLLIALFLIWFFVWEPQAREARAERKRLAEEERVRLEAKREKLKSERDDLLRSERLGAPGFIIRESLDFEREYPQGVGMDLMVKKCLLSRALAIGWEKQMVGSRQSVRLYLDLQLLLT